MHKVSFLRTDFTGSSYYRLDQPKSHLIKNNKIECLDNGSGYSPLSEIVIWQRYGDIELLPALDRNQIHVFEIDDNYWDLPPYLTEVKSYYSRHLKSMEKFLCSCDYVITTTDELADNISNNTGFDNERIFRIPNYIDTKKLHYGQKGNDGIVRIAWTLDSRRKDFDILPVQNVLLRLLKTYPNVQLLFFGGLPKVFEGHPQVKFIKAEKTEIYYNNLLKSNIDIGICPAQNNDFNDCKSDLKFLEFGALGCPVVCSNIKPYKSIRTSCCEDENDWEEKLESYITDKDLRFSHGLMNYKHVHDKCGIDSMVKSYDELFDFMKEENKGTTSQYYYSDIVKSYKSSKKFLYVVSTRDSSKLNRIKNNVNKYSLHYDIDVVFVENDGDFGLAEFYNKVVESYEADYYIFAHDDVQILDEDWLTKLLKGFDDFDVIGVAGGSYYDPLNGIWCSVLNHNLNSGCVLHPKNGGKSFSYSNYGPGNREVLVIDGLFMAIKADVLRDVPFKGYGKYHFYDICMSLDSREAGYSVGVVPINIEHDSIGSYSDSWMESLVEFRKDYGSDVFRLKKEKFPHVIHIDRKLKDHVGISYMTTSLDRQSIEVSYKFVDEWDGTGYLLDSVLIFHAHAFEMINEVLGMGYEEITFKAGDCDLIVGNSFGKRYEFSQRICKDFDTEFVGITL
jgi:glycosyltransferase involved in cell wall biosynthesis